ncbi:auxin canalization protein (DUF828) [Tasmannia lanceolata]|uniref:auxin canalization protein (DUF828) n=1 Tax=Tasmannia lanceolata TaxID=3420 RepID=UPI004063E75A
MDSDMKMTAPEATLDSMDFLSRAWFNTTIHVVEPMVDDRSIMLQENLVKTFKTDIKAPRNNMQRMDMDDGDVKAIPSWKSDDLKSWICMQKAMHPELNYGRCFRKKWMPWKLMPFKGISIKKWVKDLKQKRKEEERLQKAEVHAAITVAGVAAALAAVAAENAKNNQPNTTKEAAVASAAALVAAQCAQVAEDMGANHEQLSAAMGSAMTTTNAANIFTLTAAAATSLRGAATLRARPGRRERDGIAPPLPLKEKKDLGFDFGKYRILLAKGSQVIVRTSDGKCKLRFVSVILDSKAKVILRTRKINVLKSFARTKESIVLNLHEDSISEADAQVHFIALTTSRGTIKLEMKDYAQYNEWIVTINHMLMLSTTFTGYEIQFYRN